MRSKTVRGKKVPVCNHDCENCIFPECICDDPPTLEETECIQDAIGGYAKESQEEEDAYINGK